MHAHNPILKHPFVRDGQRYPRLAAILRGLLEIPNVPVAGVYAYLQGLPDEKLQRLALRIARAQRYLRKARAIRSMKAVLGGADGTDTRFLELWEANCRHVGLTVSEIIRWDQMPLERATDCVTVAGAEHIHEALAVGRGAMIMGAHLGNMISFALAIRRTGLDVCSTGNAMPVRFLEERLERLAHSCGAQHVLIGDRLPGRVGETFRRGAAFLTFVDFTLPETRNVWVRFGNAETHVSLGPALLALRHRVPVICLSSERLKDARHRVTFHPPLTVTRSGDFRADATRLTQQAMDIVVAGIRQRPEQWWQWDVVPIRSASG